MGIKMECTEIPDGYVVDEHGDKWEKVRLVCKEVEEEVEGE